jgi:hypothetical protein
MVHLRHQLATLLDNLYGLHFRPGHLDAILRVVLALPEPLLESLSVETYCKFHSFMGTEAEAKACPECRTPSLSVEEKKEP